MHKYFDFAQQQVMIDIEIVNLPSNATQFLSYSTYALYREKALHESCQVLVEHAQRVAKKQVRTQTESVFI